MVLPALVLYSTTAIRNRKIASLFSALFGAGQLSLGAAHKGGVSVDSDRPIIVEIKNRNGDNEPIDFTLPYGDYLFGSFHYHAPSSFALQGADWMPGSDNDLGRVWTATPTNLKKIDTDFDRIYDWGREAGVKIFLAEFGAIKHADLTSRAQYNAAVARAADERLFAYTLWEDNDDFSIRDENGDMIPELIDAFTKPHTVVEETLKNPPNKPDGPSVLVDAFEVGDIGQSELSMTVNWKTDVPLRAYDWGVISSKTTDWFSHEGIRIVDYFELLDGEFSNIESARDPQSFDRNGIWLETPNETGSIWPFAHVSFAGSMYGEKEPITWYDCSSLEFVTFWARGQGELDIGLVTQAVFEGYPTHENRGHFSHRISLRERWQYYVIDTMYLEPMQNTPAARDGLTWEDSKAA